MEILMSISKCRNVGDIIFWEGFDAAINMVINMVDMYDSNELARLSVFDFVEKIKEDIIEEAERCKKDE